MSGHSQVLKIVQELNISVLSHPGHPIRCICGHKRGGDSTLKVAGGMQRDAGHLVDRN